MKVDIPTDWLVYVRQTESDAISIHWTVHVFPWRWEGNSRLEMLPSVGGPNNLGPGVSLSQGTESVKWADASASVAGKETGASARQRQPSTASTRRAKCVVEEARVCVAGVSAPTPGASAASVNTAPRVTQPAMKTGMCSPTPDMHKAVPS